MDGKRHRGHIRDRDCELCRKQRIERKGEGT